MSGPGRWRHYPVVERFGYHLARTRAWARRVTGLGLAVRVVIWLAGLGGLLLALPGPLGLGPVLPVVALLAVLPALSPGGSWVTVLQLVAIGTVAVRAAAPPADPPVPVLLLLGAVLYGHHTAAALGAQLRTDTVVPVAVVRHWAGRAGLVVLASAGLSLGIVAVAGRAPAGPDTGYLAAGAVAAVALVAAVSWLLLRRAE